MGLGNIGQIGLVTVALESEHGGQSLWRRQARVKYFNLESRAYGESFFLHDENSLTLVALTGATEAKDDET